jgi:bilin biosynthesis protein
MLKASDSSVKLKVLAMLQKHHLVRIDMVLAGQNHQRAVAGFQILGHEASAAIPELINLLSSEFAVDGNRAMEISLAISNIGKDSIPFLLPLLTNSNPTLRGEAAMALGRVNPPRFVIAEVVPLLHDENARVRTDTAVAFSNLRNELALPSLIVNLQDTNVSVRHMSAVALGFYGKKASAAVPALEQAARDQDSSVRQAAQQALAMIPRELKRDGP